MKKGWLILQVLQLMIFAGVSIFLFVRTVDGSGAVQTPAIRLTCFLVWTAFYLGLLAIEWGIHLLIRRQK